MAYVLADNIISPLGDTSEANYLSVKAGKSGLHAFAPEDRGLAEGFVASLLSDEQRASLQCNANWTYFEQLAYASALRAIEVSGIDVGQENVCFILSTTKGAIEALSAGSGMNPSLGASAQKIAERLGFITLPIVVCNACISGLSALILASRLLEQGKFEYAVVCGADCPDRFIISGFQSLKALSTKPCRPFDMDRFGLNLGEASATMVLAKEAPSHINAVEGKDGIWQIGNGFIKNDAFHISTPSKTSEGLYAALQETLQYVDIEDLAFVNAHGTATLFNDQMESVAIQRAGLSAIPTNALKGNFGHTLGTAGILETILSMKAIDDHMIVGTRGFEELGVSGRVNISAENRATDKKSFIKMLSGFGGCNATLLATKQKHAIASSSICCKSYQKTHLVKITTKGVEVDGEHLSVNGIPEYPDLITSIYKQYIGDYPKFYKMDHLSRLGFVASELLLRKIPNEDCSIILFNHSSSIDSDRKYLESINDKDNYYPSPSVFVYTLPNIVTGEIAIRNGFHGETSFYVLPERNEKQMRAILETAFMDAQTKKILTGWIDYEDDAHYVAELYIAELR